MSCPRFFFVASLLPSLMFGQGQGVKPEDLLKPLKDSWPTYNGDYSGKRYSALKQVNRTNVQHLTLAWSMRFTSGKDEPQAGRRRGRGLQEKLIVGGEGPGDIAIRGGTIKASVLEADGTLYFTMPDNAWAVDALLNWDNELIPENVLHIHGTHDKVLPYKNVTCNYTIEKGQHLMVMQHADTISSLLKELVCSPSFKSTALFSSANPLAHQNLK